MSDKKRVLIYGDSNSWGYLDDGLGHRFERRWPVEMSRQLSQSMSVSLIEECLPGRTTNLPDPVMGTSFNGLSPFETVLLSHQPLDHVLIMLGTNDLKARFNRTADDIATALVGLGQLAKSISAGRGGWLSTQTAEVTLICPLVIGQRASAPDWERASEWDGAPEKSKAFPSALQAACSKAGLQMIDGNQFGRSSERDPIHWDQETHIGFGRRVAEALKPHLAQAAQKRGG